MWMRKFCANLRKFRASYLGTDIIETYIELNTKPPISMIFLLHHRPTTTTYYTSTLGVNPRIEFKQE